MKRHFDEGLKNFNADLLKMANLTERAIVVAVEALQARDAHRAEKTIKGDALIDSMELIIEGKGIDLLALHQPMATDLRTVTTGLKINSELERISDLVVNISQRVLEVVELPALKPFEEMSKLGEIARTMTRDAIESFVNRDMELAKKVILTDPQANHLKDVISDSLVNEQIVKDGSTAPQAIPLLLVARYLERICDHCTYIAEDVIFMIDATVVKHHRSDIFEEQGES